MASRQPNTRCFLTGCHHASSLVDLCDTQASSMAWEGARRLRAVQHPSVADNDGTPASSTALTIFSDSVSSRTIVPCVRRRSVVEHALLLRMTTLTCMHRHVMAGSRDIMTADGGRLPPDVKRVSLPKASAA